MTTVKKKFLWAFACFALAILIMPVMKVKAYNGEPIPISQFIDNCVELKENEFVKSKNAGGEDVNWYKFTVTETGDYYFYSRNASQCRMLYVKLYCDYSEGKAQLIDAETEYASSNDDYAFYAYSFSLTAGKTYYLAISDFANDKKAFSYEFGVTKASSIKSVSIKEVAKTIFYDESSDVEAGNTDLAGIYMVYIEYANGLKERATAYINYYKMAEESDGKYRIGYVNTSQSSGKIIMDKSLVDDFNAKKLGAYDVTFVINDKITNKDIEVKSIAHTVSPSEAYGNNFEDLYGLKGTTSLDLSMYKIYRGAVSVNEEREINAVTSRGYGIINYFRFAKIDDQGKIEKLYNYYLDGYNTIISLPKGRYYFLAIVYGFEPMDFLFGDPIARVKTTDVSMLNSASMEVGASLHLDESMVLSPADSTDTLFWTTSDKSVAEVDSRGVVKAVGPGTAQITVYVGDYSAVCTVTVVAPSVTSSKDTTTKTESKKLSAQKIKLSKTTISIKKNKTVKLSKYVKVSDKAKLTFKKLSGNKKISLSSSGKLSLKKGIKKGTYKIKVKISAKETGSYTSASATKTIKIKVK